MRNGTDMPSPSTVSMVSLRLGQRGSILAIPQAATENANVFYPRVYTEHFSSVEFVPNLPNNTKCHLLGLVMLSQVARCIMH